MPSFAFIATDDQGNRRTGKIEAPSRSSAYNKLRENDMHPLSLEPIKQSANIEDILDRFRGIKPDVLVYFTRQLATMIDSGMSPLRAIGTLQEQERNPKFKEILSTVVAEVENGTPLSEAMREHPEAFSRLYVAMVRSGEESGSLHNALNELAAQLEKQSRLNKAIKSALLYPKIVLAFSFIIVSGLLMTIVPKFSKIFQESVESSYNPASGEPKPSADLPALTQVILDLSRLLYPEGTRDFLWILEVAGRFILLFIIIFLIAKLIRYILSQEDPRRRWDQFKLRAPMKIGPLVQKIVIARFSRTFASLLRAGVPAVEAMNIVADTSGNVIVSEAVLKAREQMLAGSSIYEPLAQSGAFPVTVTKMIQVGEETGKLELMLVKIAEFFEEEVDISIKGLTSIIEPLMIIIIGLVIGLVILSIYLPMFSIYDKVGTGIIILPLPF